MRYGDPSCEALNAKTEWGACIYAERTIYLNPTLRLRKNRAKLFDSFLHELLHAIDESAPRKSHWRKLSHPRINSIAMELGVWLAENEQKIVTRPLGGPVKHNTNNTSV